MIAIYKKSTKKKKKDLKALEKATKPRDIIIKRVSYVMEENEQGDLVRRKREKLVNITKIVNESKKLIKCETASQKITNMQEELINKGVL